MASNYLKRWRLERKMTQQQLAVKAGVSIDYVRVLEQHPERMASTSIAEKLARALDVDSDQLFFRPDYGTDRIAKLGDLYSDDLLEADEATRSNAIRFVLAMDPSMWKIYARGKTPWVDLLKNAEAFADYIKKFPSKQ